MRRVLYQEKTFKNFDLSDMFLVDDDFISMIDQMCPTIKCLTLRGDNLETWAFQCFADIILPFRFLHELHLTRAPVVESFKFLWQSPITLTVLTLDSLYVSADQFVQFVPVLSNQLTSLSMASNPQLTKYDLVQILQKFWKLDTLNIVDSEYLTPGTCETIARYCYNLEKFLLHAQFPSVSHENLDLFVGYGP